MLTTAKFELAVVDEQQYPITDNIFIYLTSFTFVFTHSNNNNNLKIFTLFKLLKKTMS